MPEREAAVLERPAQDEAPQIIPPRGDLPIVEAKGRIMQAMGEKERVIVLGHTGSGKTTMLPRFLHKVVSGSDPNARVLVTQPRKFAARSLAAYVASQVGKEMVGHRFKGENTITEKTKIGFVVDGSLVNALAEDPLLKDYSAVMVDEVHEATIDIHLELALLKKAQELRRQQGMRPLKVVLASATVDRKKLEDYYSGSSSFEVPGKLFDIKDHFLPKGEEVAPEQIPAKAAEVTAKILLQTQGVENKDGDILIFMPGRADIAATIRNVSDIINQTEIAGKENIEVIPITGGEQDKSQQDRITKNNGKRKVIIATNVAQTSVTIPNLQYVIDSGLVKVNTFDQNTGLTTLRLIQHTQADWKQRRGRAGRVRDGECYSLFTESQFKARPEFQGAEIQRADLSAMVLRMKQIGIEDVHGFDFIDHPSKENIDAAIETLQKLGALDATGKITEIGKQMAEIPTDPHFARMLVEAKKRGCVEAVSVLVGFLSSPGSVFAYNPRAERFEQRYAKYRNEDSDYLTLLNVWNAFVGEAGRQGGARIWAQQNGFSPKVLHDVANTKNELLSEEIFEGMPIDRSEKAINIADEATALAIQQSVVAGLTDRILVRSGDTYSLENGKRSGIAADRSSVIGQSPAEMIVSGAIRAQEKGGTYAGMNQKVTGEMIKEVAPHLESMQKAKEELEKEKQAAVAEAERIERENQVQQETSAAQGALASAQAEAEQKLSFFGKLKKAWNDFWSRVKRFLRL